MERSTREFKVSLYTLAGACMTSLSMTHFIAFLIALVATVMPAYTCTVPSQCNRDPDTKAMLPLMP